MGTRHLVCAIVNNQFRLAQYGQWDGYPEGQGATVCDFIKNNNMTWFRCRLLEIEEEKNLNKIVEAYCDGEWMTMEQSDNFKKDYPQFHRDTGGKNFEYDNE
jgi:hypothetical protein